MGELGTVLGVRFELDNYASDGFQLTLTNDDTQEKLFDNRMIGYTIWEAVIKACFDVWEKEIATHDADELPNRIATALNIPEIYGDNEECHKCGYRTNYEEMTQIGLGSGVYECEECWRNT